MKLVVDWREAEFDEAAVGGKARALGVLSRAGFSVPDWRVVLPPAREANFDQVLAELGAFLEDRKGPWAVRSSASDEDGPEHSFAGQLESFLNVPRDQLEENIRAVWASGTSDRVMAYRSQAGLSGPVPVPGVIVQSMVAAEFSGVGFGADPVSGRRGVAVVAVVGGLGERLVSGEVTGDVYHVDRSGQLVGRAEAVADGPRAGDDLVRDVSELARRAQRIFGCPQDIEWASSGGKVFLLQSRPITSLRGRTDPDGAWQLWDNSNIAESYSGVTTPLTFSFARHIYEEVYRQFVHILRVPGHRIEANRDVFGRMLGLMNGQVYYNLLSWYRVLAMLPGFAVNRTFMEQMMGVKEPLPPEALEGIVGTGRATGWRDYLEIVSTLTGLVASHWTLEAKTRAFYARLDQVLAVGPVGLESCRPDELAAAYRRLQNELLTRWDAPLVNDFFAMIYFGLSRKLVDKWCGDPEGTLQNDLITGQGGIISAEPAQRMMRLADEAKKHPELLALLDGGRFFEIEGALPQYPEFAAGFQEYLDKFGDRCLEELKLESSTLRDEPLMLLRSIARLAGRRVDRRPVQSPAEAAWKVVKQQLSGHFLRRRVFGFVLAKTRDRVRDRENLRFERTRVFGRVRTLFVELGKRLWADGILDHPRDVFFLETEEVVGFVEGTASTTDLRGLVRLRRREFARWAKEKPDGRFETRGVVYNGQSFQREVAPEAAEGEERKGLGCCPGVVRGRARVILDPRNAGIEPGEILVAPRTDPGWIMLFPSAAGLLVEHGSLLSHSAIVAREMGIPAVVAVENLTDWLQTGDLVELDGATGRVTRLEIGGTDHAE